jgi:hypothetical protein
MFPKYRIFAGKLSSARKNVAGSTVGDTSSSTLSPLKRQGVRRYRYGFHLID